MITIQDTPKAKGKMREKKGFCIRGREMLVRMNGIGIELKLSGSNRLGFQHRPDLTGTDQT